MIRVFDHQYGFPVRSIKPSVRTAVFPLFFHLLHALERVFVRFSRRPEQALYDSADFAWTRELEASWQTIRRELRSILAIPEPQRSRMRVGTTLVQWKEGRALVFDDTFEHEVWNDSARERVVLFID